MSLHAGSLPGKDVARLLSFGRGGHCIDYTSGAGVGYSRCTHSGYDSPETFGPLTQWWAHPKGEMCSPWSSMTVPPEGIPVIDKLPALATPEGRSWVFRGPMVDVDLPDGGVDCCPQPSEVLAAGVDDDYRAMLLQQEAARAAGKRSPLDSVCIAEYVDGWRKAGARIGRAFREADGTARLVWEVDAMALTCQAVEVTP